jgi:hypothetical protein
VLPYHPDTAYFYGGERLVKYYGNGYLNTSLGDYINTTDNTYTPGRDFDVHIAHDHSSLWFTDGFSMYQINSSGQLHEQVAFLYPAALQEAGDTTTVRAWRIHYSTEQEALVSLYPFDYGFAHFADGKWQVYPPYSLHPDLGHAERMAKDEYGNIWLQTDKWTFRLSPMDKEAIDLPSLEKQQLLLYPNPACCLFRLRWEQAQAGQVRLDLYSINGKFERTIRQGDFTAGTHDIGFMGPELPKGVYLVQATLDGEVFAVEKLVVQ